MTYISEQCHQQTLFLGEIKLGITERHVQRWAKEWALGCVNSPPAAGGSQETGFTQPRDHSFAQPCTFFLFGGRSRKIQTQFSQPRTCFLLKLCRVWLSPIVMVYPDIKLLLKNVLFASAWHYDFLHLQRSKVSKCLPLLRDPDIHLWPSPTHVLHSFWLASIVRSFCTFARASLSTSRLLLP